MKKFLSLLLGILLIATVTGGCSGLTSTGAGVASNEASNEARDSKKYNAYIELSNEVNGGFYDGVFSIYPSEFGIDKEMYIDDNFDGFGTTPFIPTVIDGAKKTLELASAEPSYGTTDDAVKKLMPIIIDLMNTNNDIQSYYAAKTYVDDKFEQGHELHTRYISFYEKYIEAAQQFHLEFTRITNERKYEGAEELKKQDLLIRYYAMSSILRAQDIQEAFYTKEVGNENILEFDLKEYETLYELLSNDINQYLEYSSDADRSKKEAWPGLGTFKMSIEGVKVTATDILQILREQDPEINSDTAGKVTTGGGNAILNTFDRKISSLVDAYNNSLKITVVN